MKKKPSTKTIPPPPGKSKSWEEKAAYYETYSIEQLEAAGYARPLTKDEERILDEITKRAQASVAARKDRKQLNLTVSEEALSRLDNVARRDHIPSTTLARAWVLQRLERESAQELYRDKLDFVLSELAKRSGHDQRNALTPEQQKDEFVQFLLKLIQSGELQKLYSNFRRQTAGRSRKSSP